MRVLGADAEGVEVVYVDPLCARAWRQLWGGRSISQHSLKAERVLHCDKILKQLLAQVERP
eukprot:4377834-Pyramimonas_sp.AAC.1